MTRFERLSAYWVYGGTLAGVMLLAMMPALTRGWPLPLTLVLLQLPLYMLHQYEEHDDDSFRIFCNHWIGRDTDVLPAVAVWIINIPFVWGIIAGALYLAEFVHIGYGLIAVYLPIVNAFAHIGAALAYAATTPDSSRQSCFFYPSGSSRRGASGTSVNGGIRSSGCALASPCTRRSSPTSSFATRRPRMESRRRRLRPLV